MFGSIKFPSTRAVPGDSSADPKTAFLDDNTGTISSDQGSFYFRFTPSSAGTFGFSLVGPTNTDFDMDVRIESTNALLGDASGVSYPDRVIISNINISVIVEIFSLNGVGDFTINIQTPTTATLGDNPGTIPTENDTVIFRFTPASSSPFKFSLTGPANTDFDFNVIDDLTNDILDGASGITYPDEVIIWNINESVIIDIYSVSGSGDFTFNIQTSTNNESTGPTNTTTTGPTVTKTLTETAFLPITPILIGIMILSTFKFSKKRR